MTGDKPRVVIVHNDPPRKRLDNSHRGLSIREHGKTYIAICGFLALTLFPITLFIDPMMSDGEPFYIKVVFWIGFITFFAFVKYISEKSTGWNEEATFLPTIIGVTLCGLVSIVGDQGTIGLLSFGGVFVGIGLLIIFIATITMAFDRVWEPLMVLSGSTAALTWLAHVSNVSSPEAVTLPLVFVLFMGVMAVFAMLVIVIQGPDDY